MSRNKKKIYRLGETVLTETVNELNEKISEGWKLVKDVDWVWIVNYNKLIHMKVGKDELAYFEDIGWESGMLPSRMKMTNGNEVKTVKRSEYVEHLKSGWYVYYNKYRRTSNNYRAISDAFSKDTYVKRRRVASRKIDSDIQSFPGF